MGSFNVSGGMSNLSIGYRDKVVFFPLIPTNYKYNKDFTVTSGPATSLISNEGACIFYEPAFLPIYGEYNDYGSIENIERDANVEYIEKFFGITIEQFMNQITRNWCNEANTECKTDDLTEMLRGMSGMFELQEVYQKMSSWYHVTSSVYKEGNLSLYILERLGFVCLPEKDTGDTRYRYCCTHPDIPQYEFHSDGVFSHAIDLSADKKQINLYCIEHLNKFLSDNDIKLSDYVDLSIFKNRSEYEFMVDEAIQKIRKTKTKIAETEDQELAKIYEKYELKEVFNGRFPKWSLFDYVGSAQFKDPLVNLLNFNIVMYLSNNMFFPALSGPQDGSKETEMALLEVSQNILNSKTE